MRKVSLQYMNCVREKRQAIGRRLCCLLVFCTGALFVVAQDELPAREKYLRELLKINIEKDHRHAISRRLNEKDSTWLDWQKRTGELPPDFSKMKSIPFLPEPLELETNGQVSRIVNEKQWEEKRLQIKKEFQHWVSGTVPPSPKNIESRVLSDKTENGTRIQLIELRFGPQHQAKMTLELMIPQGNEKMPVYMTQWTHRNWAELAVSRGYIGCVYAAADGKDDTQAYQALYPDYDFTCLMRRAWGASRVVDYLLTRSEVDAARIAITGHSRNGKQSLWAAAFDERFAAVISSSCGTGGVTPWRYSDPQYCNQTIDDICSNAAHWFHPRLRFFFGKEDRLPVDQNLLLSLIAPRTLLLHYSVMERQLNPWATEQCVLSVKKVYDFMQAGDQIGVLPRFGEHAVAARDLGRCIDFLDIHFQRKNIPWENKFYFGYSYADWVQEQKAEQAKSKQIASVRLRPEKFSEQKDSILKNLEWLLGDEPALVKPAEVTATTRVDWMDGFTGRPQVQRAKKIQLGPYTAMGGHLAGILYMPEKRNGKVPAVIYLHQYAYAHGFACGYNQEGNGRGNTELFQSLIDRGMAVLAIDLFSCGTRMEEAEYFYQRHPQWSKMGKMVGDVRACVDALENMTDIDAQRIFVLGNTLGGSVGLIASALDDRIAAVAAVAAFSPWRSSKSQYESLLNFSQQHLLLPRLGWFADVPNQVPVDWPEIVACIAPRPQMIISPVWDRHTDPAAVQQCSVLLKKIYAKGENQEQLQWLFPEEINRMTREMNEQVAEFFSRFNRTN